MKQISAKQVTLPLLTPQQIFSYLDGYVVGQHQAKRTLAVAAYNHMKRCLAPKNTKTQLKKSNVLLVGPTGCGKTRLASKLAELLKLPFTITDATEYTEAGYYGKDVEVMVAELLYKAHHSVEEAQRGIVFIDEIDKLARRAQGGKTGTGNRDIGGEGVQQALLKILEGRELFVPLNITQNWNKHDFVQIDTTDILFIAAGTFSELQCGDQTLGITPQDLINYGMMAEFLGRLPVLVQLEQLDENQLMTILRDPLDSIPKKHQYLLYRLTLRSKTVG